MFKKTFTKIVAIMAVTFGVSFVTPAMNQYANQTTVAHADASTLEADGPWETTNRENKPIVQQLHNGNEIYYSIAPNDTNTDLFQSAVSKWNALGVIKLVQVNWGDSQSQITMQTTSDPTDDDTTEADGNTSFTGVNNLQNNANIGQANIKLYTSLSTLTNTQQSVAAQHELGHALGFAHDNRTLKSNGKKYRHYHFVMNEHDDQNHYYKLGGIEQHMLEDHYNLTASVDLSDMNC